MGEGMMLENIQKVIDSLEAQQEKPFAVIMSPKNLKALMNEMNQENIIISDEPTMLFGLRIEAHKYFPEDQVLCVTKDGYDKIKGEAISNLLNMKCETWEERAERIKRFLSEFYGEQNFTKLKEINMQEIKHDDTVGETHVEDTIEDLIPHIKKSLANPKVKYVKIFRGKDQMDDEKFTAEEEKKNILDEIAEQK